MSLLFRHLLALAPVLLSLILVVLLMPGKVSIWIDEEGHTLLTNRSLAPREGMIRLAPADLSLAWRGRVTGKGSVSGLGSSSEEDRFHRELLGARDDIIRGETRRGLRTLRRLNQSYPGRPEPAWLLARVERRRGRLEPARDALDSILQLAAAIPDNWRQAADKLRGEIDAELAHAERAYVEGSPIEVSESEHFLLSYDHSFAGRQFGEQVLTMLQQVRAQVGTTLGRGLSEPIQVRLYTKAHYLEEHQHRFGFATVGFYDGAIHVVSARRPRNELRALLTHEYVHAVFEDALGGHQPFFLNEGIADRHEERVRGRGELTRTEWRQLLEADRDGSWIQLGSIIQGFGGLEGKRALLAYLESRAAVELIERRHPGGIARWLERCSKGQAWEEALEAETGWDTLGLQRALLREVRDRFPPDPLTAGDELRPSDAQEGA